jgi:TIR domain
MPVFISHKSIDKPEALNIASYLLARGIQSYVDILDPQLQTTDDITSMIVTRVRQCTHLMAITSANTISSWWVPFEIGVATDQDRRISTYTLEATNLPDYLKKWPILKNKAHLDQFIELYKRDKVVALNESTMTRTITSADNFHRSLKSRIGQ